MAKCQFCGQDHTKRGTADGAAHTIMAAALCPDCMEAGIESVSGALARELVARTRRHMKGAGAHSDPKAIADGMDTTAKAMGAAFGKIMARAIQHQTARLWLSPEGANDAPCDCANCQSADSGGAALGVDPDNTIALPADADGNPKTDWLN